MSSDYQLEDTLYLPFTTRAFATGIPTALVSGVIDIYEDVTATPIVTAETLTVSLNSHAGFNMITVTATAASGFGAGQSYTAILDAGTVDSVSVIGEVVAHFTLNKSAAAKDLANGTDGLGAIKAETALIVADTGELQTDDVPALIAAVQSDTDNLQTRLPAALVGGAMDSDVSAIQANAVNASAIATDAINEIARAIGIQTNTAFSDIPFLMVLSSDHVSPATGLSPTGERSIDAGAFVAVSGPITEISDGMYQFDAAAADLNGATITLRFSAATADDVFLTIKTVS